MFTACGAKRGFTLLEVMVAAFLASIILYVLVSLLIPSIRHSRLGATRVDLDQRAALLDARLTRSLKSTPRAGVGYWQDAAVTILTTHPVVGTGPDSSQTWSPTLDVFRWTPQDQRLVGAQDQMSEGAVYEEAAPAPVVPGPNLVIDSFSSYKVTSVTEGVTAFTVIKDGGPRVDFEVVLTVDKEQVRLLRTVFLVNSTQ